MIDKLISAIGNFLLVFFLLTVAWAVCETLGYFNPQPLALRNALAFAMVALSAAFAAWRWMRTPTSKATTHRNATPVQGASDARLAAHTDALHSRATPPGPTQAAAARPAPRCPGTHPAIAQAARQAVVFRQIFPPAHGKQSLNFWGGTPVAPPEFAWPRGKDGSALGFVMQIDCEAIPAEGRLGLMPELGVLYFFLDLEWGAPHGHVAFVEHGDAWRQIMPPADLKPAFGGEAKYMFPWAADDTLPQLLPRWPFTPVVVDMPPADCEHEEDEDDAPPFAPGEPAIASALLAAQGDGHVPAYFSIREFRTGDGNLVLPFDSFPQDWRALAIMAAAMQERADHARRYDKRVFGDMPQEEREALLAGIAASGAAWKEQAASQQAFDAVPPHAREEFRAWLAKYAQLSVFCMEKALTQAVEASLSGSECAAARVPPEIAARVLHRHVLAMRSGENIHANMPDRMLAAPSDVQGNQYQLAKTHLLLLEMSSNEGLSHHFGEGVYQFWITPDDLAAQRFDKVVLTADAY